MPSRISRRIAGCPYQWCQVDNAPARHLGNQTVAATHQRLAEVVPKLADEIDEAVEGVGLCMLASIMIDVR